MDAEILTITHDADTAMYQAKKLSKSSLYIPHRAESIVPQGFSFLHGNSKPIEPKFLDHRKVLRAGYGSGRLIQQDETEPCEFKVVQFSDGEMRLSYRLVQKSQKSEITEVIFKRQPLKGKFEGQVNVRPNESNCLISSNDVLLDTSGYYMDRQEDDRVWDITSILVPAPIGIPVSAWDFSVVDSIVPSTSWAADSLSWNGVCGYCS